MAVAAASFKTVILSISAGFRPAMAVCPTLSISFSTSILGMFVPSNGIPSNTHKGSWVPFSEEVPRIRILAGAPGAPDILLTESPAICPVNAWSMLLAAPTIWSEISIFDTAAVSLRRSTVWYPVTTTASSIWAEGWRVISYCFLPGMSFISTTS